MSRERKFDWDEARRLYEEGWSKADLCRFFGVSNPSISNAVEPGLYEQKSELKRMVYFAATCEDCGAACSKNWYSKHTDLTRIVCLKCSHERLREDALLARLDEYGAIHCCRCDTYRPIGEYRMTRYGYPEGRCRSCETEARVDYRHRHLEQERAWDRERRRKQRAAAA